MDKLAEEIKRMINNSPAVRDSTKSYGKSWALDHSGILNIYGNIVVDELESMINPSDVFHIQFARKFNVSERTLSVINDFLLLNNKSIHLSKTFNGHGAFSDLGFLKQLPNLKSFGFQSYQKIDLSPISKYLELVHLGLGGSNISLEPLHNYYSLKSLLFGDKIKDYNSISLIENLEEITILSQNLKSLKFLIPLKNLFKLSFSFGGTTHFDDLPELKEINELEFSRIRKLEIENLLPINQMNRLEILKLRELPRIIDLGWIKNSSLKTLVLQKLKGLKSIKSLEGINKIETLVLADFLTKEIIDSLEKLENINQIQVFQSYIDDNTHPIHKSKIAHKIIKIEQKYLF